jgi:hypothetical protein
MFRFGVNLLSSLTLAEARCRILQRSGGVDSVISQYRTWLSVFFYIVVYRFIDGKYEFGIFRGVKRGDKRYSFLTCRKFNSLTRVGRHCKFFGYGAHDLVRGSGLLATLEYDPHKVSLGDAWQNVGVDFNRWICGIRKVFGSVSIVRVFESHESGYPHIHVLLIFHVKVFEGRSMPNKRGKLIYRVTGSDFSILKSLSNGAARWGYGFTDFELVNSYRGGIRYLAKYLAKSTSFEEAGSKGVKTLAMCWFFHKRSFGYQGEMFSADVIGDNGISTDVGSSSRFIGFDLLGNPISEGIVRWGLFGFIVRDDVLWRDRSVFHKVLRSDLELIKQRFSNGEGAPNLYDVSSRVVFSSAGQRRLALFEDSGLSRCLDDF